jgi:hypothetical protein
VRSGRNGFQRVDGGGQTAEAFEFGIPDTLVYSNIENLVLWARSEITGCALKIIQSVE